MRLLVTIVIGLALAACGSRTNLLGATIPREHHESFETLLVSAQAAYDRGDLRRALRLSKMAFQIDPMSERASVLYGFVNLSLAKADPFALARMLAKKPEDEAGQAAGSSDTLGLLARVLGLTEAELAAISDRDDSDPELPLLLPKCAENARAALEKLRYADEAIRAVCPFVDVEARVPEDYRQSCVSTEDTRREPLRAHFLWAFAHLTEALAFNAILTYAPGSEDGRTNLQKRVDKLVAPAPGTAGLDDFVKSVGQVDALVARVMPTDGICSDDAPTTQLGATLNDLLALDLAFQRLPGTPESIRAAIARTTAALRAARDAGAGRGAQAKALKTDFTRKIAGGLAQKIDEAAAAQAPSTAQRDELCAKYAAITGGRESKPAICGP